MRLEKAGLKSDNESLLAYLAERVDPVNRQLLSELVRQLGAEDWKTREEATKKLIAMGAAAREAMEKATTHKDPEVQGRAKLVLERLSRPSKLSLVLAVITDRKLPGAVPILLARMPDMGSTDQKAARRALEACARREYIPILRNTLKADKMAAEVRATVLTVLFRVSPEADVKLMKACLADDSKAIRMAGLYAMSGKPADKSFVPLLLNLLGQEDPYVAGMAAGFLGKIGDPATADALLGVLHKSNHGFFRQNVIGALMKLKGREMAGPLIALLADTSAGSRSDVLSALGRIHAPEAAEAVIDVLADPDIHIRMRACTLLAGYADRKAVEPLYRIVANDGDPMVRSMAAFALGRIGDVRAVDSLVKLLTTDNYPQNLGSQKDAVAACKVQAREQALISLAVIGGPKATKALFRATMQSQPQVRGMAIKLLAELGDKRAGDLVLKGLDNRNFLVTYNAIDACQVLDDPRILPALIKLVTSNRNARTYLEYATFRMGFCRGTRTEAFLRARAMSLLKERWPKEACPVLLGRLKDTEESVVRRAVELLADTNDRSAIPGLMDLLENSKNIFIKEAAGTALCRLKVKAAFGACMELLQHTSDRSSLAAAMGALAEESFLDELKAELKKPKGRHRAALSVAGYVHKPELADAVVTLLDSNSYGVCEAAIEALGGLKNPKSVPALLDRLKVLTAVVIPRSTDENYDRSDAFRNQNQVRLLALALGSIGDKSAVEPLLAAMNRPYIDQHSVYCATAIAKALGQIGDARAFEPLVKIIRKYPKVAEGLALLGDKRAIPHLQAAANAPFSRLTAAKAIFKLDPAASVDAFSKFLRYMESNYTKSRVEAVELLAQVGSKQAIESIRFALTDESFEVRHAARKALASLKVPIKVPLEAPAAGPAWMPANWLARLSCG